MIANTRGEYGQRVPDADPPYVDHPELHDERVVERLIAHAEGVLAHPAEPVRYASQDALFKAMHACAMRCATTKGKRSARWRDLYHAVVEYLVSHNVGLVHDTLRRSHNLVGDEDEFLSAGLWTLYQSVKAFNPWRGFRFSTYACTSVYRSLVSTVQREGRHRSKIRAMADDNPPCDVDLSAADDDEQARDAELITRRVEAAIRSNEPELTDRERFVIRQRYLQPHRRRPETFRSIGKRMDLSVERVRQIQNSGLKKLRSVLLEDPVLISAGLVPVQPGEDL